MTQLKRHAAMKSVEPSKDAAAADAGLDIVPSGEALRVVSGWLGMNVEEALLEAGPSASSQTAAPNRRQQFLGLGAKYLPHHKAVETATALDVKLRKRLERGLAARRLQEEEAHEEEGRGRPVTCGPKPSTGACLGGLRREGPGAKRRARHPGEQNPECGQDDSDEDEHKVAAVGSKVAGGGPAGIGVTTSSKVAREAALLYAPVDCGSVKRKKAKGNKKYH